MRTNFNTSNYVPDYEDVVDSEVFESTPPPEPSFFSMFIRRFIETAISLCGLSALLSLIELIRVSGHSISDIFPVGALSFALFLVLQIFCLRAFCFNYISKTHYFSVNLTVWFIFSGAACGSSLIFSEFVNNLLFMPYRVFHFYWSASGLISAVISCVFFALVIILTPITVRFKREDFEGGEF